MLVFLLLFLAILLINEETREILKDWISDTIHGIKTMLAYKGKK